MKDRESPVASLLRRVIRNPMQLAMNCSKLLGFLLDEISIWVPHVDTSKLPDSSCSIYDFTSFQHRDVFCLECLKNLVHGSISKKAKICTSRLDVLGFRFELFPMLVDVDLLGTKDKGMPSSISIEQAE